MKIKPYLDRSVDVLLNKRFCLGITGLSNSGKTTFITSLINQLLRHEVACLPGFSPVLTGRLHSVKLHPLDDTGLEPFPYDAAYQCLTSSTPAWPASTRNISGCILELQLSRSSHFLSPIGRKQYSLFLEIRDYPGEWLLDLPLLEMSFARWCNQCNAQFSQAPRSRLLGGLLGELQTLDPLSTADDTKLTDLNARFIRFLNDCKHESKSLSLIQPGRFLIPGKIDDPNLFRFIPLLQSGAYTDGQLQQADTKSYFKICEQRYKRYLKELVVPFYKTFFKHIDRQLILVDVIGALNAGQEYITDMRQAITNITDSFAYGKQNRLLQLINPKIDKVVFAATKIDQVLSEDHESVRQLLAVIVKEAYKNAQYEGVKPYCEAVAAVRCSREITHDNRRAITGITQESQSIGYIHPTIPSRIPDGDEWQPYTSWIIPSLNPPKGISYQNEDALPHIRIDTILNELIGDKCV